MSTPSNGQFQDLDVCGNLVTQNIRSINGSTLGNHSNAFNLVNGFFLSNASVNQFSQGATYGNNSVFQQRVTIRDLTLQENFVAQGDAVYQGNFQAEQDLNAIGNNVSIGKSVDNQTRLFIKTTQPVLIEGDLSVNQRVYVSENLTVDGSLNIGPNSIPAEAIIGLDSLEGSLGATGPAGDKGNAGDNGSKGEKVKSVLLAPLVLLVPKVLMVTLGQMDQKVKKVKKVKSDLPVLLVLLVPKVLMVMLGQMEQKV